MRSATVLIISIFIAFVTLWLFIQDFSQSKPPWLLSLRGIQVLCGFALVCLKLPEDKNSNPPYPGTEHMKDVKP